MKVGILIVALLLAGCGPSCRELGGKEVMGGVIPIQSGQTVIMVPVYECIKL